MSSRSVDRALRHPEEEADSLDWYESLRDSLSSRLFEESRALARFEWSAQEASARMRVISDEVRRGSETLASLPDRDARAMVGA